MNTDSNKNKKILWGLIALAIIFVLVSYFQMRNLIFGPFRNKNNAGQQAANVQKLLVQAQTTDTDHDGLSDFQEQYVYKTSPYLADSDSDGFSDSEEVAAKSNPLDPESTPLNKKITEVNLEKTFAALQQNQELNQTEVTPQQVRDLLINQGHWDKETVDKIDDKTLIQYYNETKKETGINPQNLGQNTAPTTSQDLAGLENLSPQEIRQLLISGGMNQDLLNKIDDQTLQTIFLQTLQEQKSGQ